MKRKITLLATVIMLSLYGCNNKTDILLTSSNGEIVPDSVFTVSTTVDSSAFCPRLLEEIKSFIGRTGSRLITIQIEEKENERYVNLLTYLYYDSRLLCGYEVIDGCMIAYYYTYADGINIYNFHSMLETKESSELLKESDCAEFLIDKFKLTTDLPNGFPEDSIGYPNENSWFASNCTFDPWGRRFLIHNADSLELVFEGFY